MVWESFVAGCVVGLGVGLRWGAKAVRDVFNEQQRTMHSQLLADSWRLGIQPSEPWPMPPPTPPASQNPHVYLYSGKRVYQQPRER